MRNLLIGLTIVSALISGCASSAKNSWICEAGTCVPKYAMNEDKVASATIVNNQAVKVASIYNAK